MILWTFWGAFTFLTWKVIQLDIEKLQVDDLYHIDMSILFEIKYLVSFSSSKFRLWLSWISQPLFFLGFKTIEREEGRHKKGRGEHRSFENSILGCKLKLRPMKKKKMMMIVLKKEEGCWLSTQKTVHFSLFLVALWLLNQQGWWWC